VHEQANVGPASDAEFVEIQRFLTREATLLDQRKYTEWLQLLADTVRYRVTACVIREATLGNQHYAIVDEDMAGLRARVDQISNPRLTRAENPPTLTRRLVSNVEAHRLSDGSYAAESTLLIYRNKAIYPQSGLYVGGRKDILQRVKGELRIAARHVDLDHQVMPEGAVSTLF
jgi:ethylbenzene dioxygenase subunit beta